MKDYFKRRRVQDQTCPCCDNYGNIEHVKRRHKVKKGRTRATRRRLKYLLRRQLADG